MTTSIHSLELGTMDNFIHIIADNETRQAMVVDPAWDDVAILTYLQQHDLILVGILLTHTHHDHISSVDKILAKHTVPVYVSKEEYRLGLLRLKKVTHVADGETISLGNATITAMLTPGHTLGSLCYLVDNHIITGDTLFIDGCGRCNFLESNVDKMYDSMQRIKALPDDLTIYSGHHYGQQKTDTLGNQKQTNPYLLIDDKDFFVAFRMDLQAQYRSIPFVPSDKAEMAHIYQKHFT